MNRLIILDFSTGEVDIYPIDSENPDIGELFSKLGHNEANCQWMISDGNITMHKEILK